MGKRYDDDDIVEDYEVLDDTGKSAAKAAPQPGARPQAGKGGAPAKPGGQPAGRAPQAPAKQPASAAAAKAPAGASAGKAPANAVAAKQPAAPANRVAAGSGKPAASSINKPEPEAKGGPVMRKSSAPIKPDKPVRPSETLRAGPPGLEEGDDQGMPPIGQRGKISARSNLMIWVICIGVIFVILAAVGSDYIFDWTGRQTKNNGGGNDPNNTAQNTSRRPPPPVDKRAEAIKMFIRSTELEKDRVRQSRAYEFVKKNYQDFEDAVIAKNQAASAENPEPKAVEEAWAICFKAYFNAKYAVELLYFKYDQYKGMEDHPNLDNDSVGALYDRSSALLADQGFVVETAARLVVNPFLKKLMEFFSDKKSILTASKVWTDDTWKEKVFGPAKKRADRAANEWANIGEKAFDQADVDFVNQAPDRDPNSGTPPEGGQPPQGGTGNG